MLDINDILLSSAHGGFDEGGAPFLPGSSSLSSKMKGFHDFHQVATLVISTSLLEITVGRNARAPPTRSIVFVMRSGIDISRLLPRSLLRCPLST